MVIATVPRAHAQTPTGCGRVALLHRSGAPLQRTLLAVFTHRKVIGGQTDSHEVTIAQKCTNRGTDPVVASGVAAVVDWRGKLVGRTALPARRLLPGETATIAGEFAGDLAPGNYRVLVTYDFEGRKTVTAAAETSIR